MKYYKKLISKYLNIIYWEAHVNALMRSDEFIMESCVTFDKIKLLIYDLIMSEMWKQYVYPHLKNHFAEISTLRSYTAI